MKKLDALGVASFNEAYADLTDSINSLGRTVNAALMMMYPDREELERLARKALDATDTDGIEINVLTNKKQITIVAIPSKDPTRPEATVEIRERESLCVLTVGLGVTLAVDDVNNSEFLKNHATVGNPRWAAWCSAPVEVNSFSAGTICALDSNPRKWTEDEARILENVAEDISKVVEQWSQEKKEK